MAVRLLTTRPLPEPDPDEGALVEALLERGVDVAVVPWREAEPTADPNTLWVPRSTWDYHLDLEAFHRVMARLAARNRLLNPLHLIRWNTRKTYLRDLRQAAIPVVKTAFVGRGEGAWLEEIVDRFGWNDIVVKPQIGAASFRTRRWQGPPWGEAQRWVDAESAERALLIQGYLRAVEGHGERSIIWIDGQITHAIRKSPRLEGQHEEASAAVPVSAEERVLADVVLRPYAGRLLYARVDVVPDDRGVPVVMELELVEPSLFLVQHPPALARFADALARLAAVAG